MNGFDYISFISPGLIIMAVINNSYSNVVGSFYGSRFNKSIEELQEQVGIFFVRLDMFAKEILRVQKFNREG